MPTIRCYCCVDGQHAASILSYDREQEGRKTVKGESDYFALGTVIEVDEKEGYQARNCWGPSIFKLREDL